MVKTLGVPIARINKLLSISDDESWLFYDFGHSVTVAGLRFLPNNYTDANNCKYIGTHKNSRETAFPSRITFEPGHSISYKNLCVPSED